MRRWTLTIGLLGMATVALIAAPRLMAEVALQPVVVEPAKPAPAARHEAPALAPILVAPTLPEMPAVPEAVAPPRPPRPPRLVGREPLIPELDEPARPTRPTPPPPPPPNFSDGCPACGMG